MSFAKDFLSRSRNSTGTCSPWFLPDSQANVKVCDPWEKKLYFEAINNEMPASGCKHCLPDCNKVDYQLHSSVQEFRACNSKLFRMSKLCGLDVLKIKPHRWGQTLLGSLKAFNLSNEDEELIKSKVVSSLRNVRGDDPDKAAAAATGISSMEKYDAFDKDIAVLNVFFAKQTAMHYVTKPSRDQDLKNDFSNLSAVQFLARF